jgi:peptidyl-tRNA hydrolase
VASQNHIPEEDLYTYVIVRRDLAMAPGKIASLAVHAARLSLLLYIKRFPERIDEFISKNLCGSAVVLYGRHLLDLEIAHERAIAAGLPTSLFKDSGHIPTTSMSGDGIVSGERNICFDGQSIVTALGIGPCTKEEARAITKRFRLV